MALNNYTNIEKAIIEWCNRTVNDTAFVEQIPNFVFLAQQQIFIDCSTLVNQKTLSDKIEVKDFPSITPAFNIFKKPSDWGRTLTLALVGSKETPNAPISVYENTILERITLERALLFEKNIKTRGKPIYYTDVDFSSIRVFPWPNKTYSYNMIYYAKLPALSPDTRGDNTNLTALNMPDILFYAALSKAYAYLSNQEESAFYDALYKERVAAMLDYDKNRLLDRNINATGFNDVY